MQRGRGAPEALRGRVRGAERARRVGWSLRRIRPSRRCEPGRRHERCAVHRRRLAPPRVVRLCNNLQVVVLPHRSLRRYTGRDVSAPTQAAWGADTRMRCAFCRVARAAPVRTSSSSVSSKRTPSDAHCSAETRQSLQQCMPSAGKRAPRLRASRSHRRAHPARRARRGSGWRAARGAHGALRARGGCGSVARRPRLWPERARASAQPGACVPLNAASGTRAGEDGRFNLSAHQSSARQRAPSFHCRGSSRQLAGASCHLRDEERGEDVEAAELRQHADGRFWRRHGRR